MESFQEFFNRYLKESPDLSIGLEGQKIRWFDDDTVTFYLDGRGGFLEGDSSLDGGIKHNILFQYILNPEKVSEETKAKISDSFSDEHKNNIRQLVQSGKVNPKTEYRTVGGSYISGRLFKKDLTIAFWNNYTEVSAKFDSVVDYIQRFKLDFSEMAFDVIDQEQLLPVSDFETKSPKKPNLTNDQVRDLMQRQHLDPNAKKALRQRAPKLRSNKPMGYDVLSRHSD